MASLASEEDWSLYYFHQLQQLVEPGGELEGRSLLSICKSLYGGWNQYPAAGFVVRRFTF
mgnify:CR=1 FL=1